MNSNEDAVIFDKYKEKIIYKSICDKCLDYFSLKITPSEAIELFKSSIKPCSNYKESISKVETILNKEGLNKYRLQFKQFKYRQKNQLVNITIKTETYNKLLAIKDDFGGINDMLFEYALDNHHHIDTAKIRDLPSCLSKNERLTVTLALLNEEVRNIIEMGLQDAYETGIRAGQEMKKQRSKKALDASIVTMKYKR